jgi:hypothetical protein
MDGGAMNTFRGFGSAVAAIAMLGGATSPLAAAQPDSAGTRVPLGCRIVASEMIVITNTRDEAISAGTSITYNAKRTSDGIHYGKTFTSGELAAGASVQKAGSPSDSCAAWFTRPLVAAPKQ